MLTALRGLKIKTLSDNPTLCLRGDDGKWYWFVGCFLGFFFVQSPKPEMVLCLDPETLPTLSQWSSDSVPDSILHNIMFLSV